MPVTIPGQGPEPIVVCCNVGDVPRPRSGEPDAFGNIGLWEAVDLVGERMYGAAWLRVESEGFSDYLNAKAIVPLNNKILRWFRVAWAYRNTSATDRRQFVQRLRDHHALTIVGDMGTPADPLDLQSERILGELQSLDAHLSLEYFEDRGWRMVAVQTRLAAAAISRWQTIRDWLVARLWKGEIPAFYGKVTVGATETVPTTYWRSEKGHVLDPNGAQGGVVVPARHLQEAMKALQVETGTGLPAHSKGVESTKPKRALDSVVRKYLLALADDFDQSRYLPSQVDMRKGFPNGHPGSFVTERQIRDGIATFVSEGDFRLRHGPGPRRR